MARRNEDFLDLLVEVPWWLSVALAAGAFICLRFLVPAVISADADFASKGIRGATPLVAWIALILLLAPAPVSAYRAWRERRLLDGQKDPADIWALSWQRFETLVAEAYRRQGYAVHKNSSQGPDGGVDLTLEKNACITLVQCKQWRAWKVGVRVVREIYGVMTDKHAHAAIVITSGTFTQEAKAFAHGSLLISWTADSSPRSFAAFRRPMPVLSRTPHLRPHCPRPSGFPMSTAPSAGRRWSSGQRTGAHTLASNSGAAPASRVAGR